MVIIMSSELRQTSEIFARRYLNYGPDEAIVSWAEKMVLSGFSSDGLLILLGEIEPFNKFEIDSLLDRIQNELLLPKIQSENEALIVIATAYVQRFLTGGASSASALSDLAQLYYAKKADVTYDFYLLHHAAADLEMGWFQHYWPNADRNNIQQIIREKCINWVEDHPLTEWQQYEWKPG